MNSYIITDNGIMVSIGMQPYNVSADHPNYDDIVDALRDEDWDAIPELANVSLAVERFVDGRIEVDTENGVVLYKGEEVHGTLVQRIVRMMTEGFTVLPLVNFLDNMMQNPSNRAVEELYDFLEYGKMAITQDGCFLAYKRVREDYTSCHDSKTDNSIGTLVQMDRNKVDDRSDHTCSHGLHFCSHEYLKSFYGDKVVVLKVNPRDVVSIPKDYNNTKGRACQYLVVGELSEDETRKALGGSGTLEGTVDVRWTVDQEDADREFDDDFEDDIDVSSLDDSEEYVTQAYINGYEHGRKDGRVRGKRPDTTSWASGDYADGYDRGFVDGKGHKARPNLVVDEWATD